MGFNALLSKNKMNKKLKNLYITLTICMFSLVSFAQEDPPADDDPLPLPINNQIIWLLIFGLVFVFFYFKNRKAIAK